ncbi:unnamed protein product [Discosporangium mesarthrocarpum]
MEATCGQSVRRRALFYRVSRQLLSWGQWGQWSLGTVTLVTLALGRIMGGVGLETGRVGWPERYRGERLLPCSFALPPFRFPAPLFSQQRCFCNVATLHACHS